MFNELYLSGNKPEDIVKVLDNPVRVCDLFEVADDSNIVANVTLTTKEQFYIYRKQVWEITNNQDLLSLQDIDKRGFTNYHLDHKVSIFYGFKNNIPAETIGDISNLRMIPYKENMRKGIKCDFS